MKERRTDDRSPDVTLHPQVRRVLVVGAGALACSLHESLFGSNATVVRVPAQWRIDDSLDARTEGPDPSERLASAKFVAPITEALEQLEHLDVLIIAGDWQQRTDDRQGALSWSSILERGVTVPWMAVRVCTDALRASTNGVIVLCSEPLSGSPTIEQQAAAAAAEHALLGLMRALATELGEFNIRVSRVLLREWSEIAAAVELVRWLVSDDAQRVTGVDLSSPH